MSAALQQQTPVVARPMLVPAPVGGWNAFNAIDQMPAQDAVILDNIFPETSYARLRRGSVLFCTVPSQTVPVQTLMEWTGGPNTRLLAAVGNTIQDVSTGTAASLGTGFHSDVWAYTNFETPAGQFVIACNASGSDIPQVYDGTTLAAAAITGPASVATLAIPLAYSNRVFYAQKDSLHVWYATPGGYQGALTVFDFGSLCQKGGAIASISTWTRDDGFGGSNELFVMVTTKGEVLVYSGTDPSNAANWQLVGRFLLGEPVAGPRCVTRIGPDMILLCEDGFQPLANYLQMGQSKTQAIALSQKIGNAVSLAVRLNKAQAGWQGLLYPQGTCIIFNVPQGDNATFYQYVVNTITGAWCRYLAWNAWSWSLFRALPYFGGANGTVWLADSGPSDNGADIVGEWLSAYQTPVGRAIIKRFTMAKANLVSNGDLTYALDVEVSYTPHQPLNTVSSNVSPGGVWGTDVWGAFLWGSSAPLSAQRRWTSVSGLGYAVAAHMKLATGTISTQINGVDVLYESGAFI